MCFLSKFADRFMVVLICNKILHISFLKMSFPKIDTDKH